MRRSTTLFTCLAVLTMPCTALANDMGNSAANTNSYGSNYYAGGNAGSGATMEPSTASLPMNPYVTGQEYIVNPEEMTNTRDNRGDIAEDGSNPRYRVYRTVSTGGWNGAYQGNGSYDYNPNPNLNPSAQTR